MKCLFRIEMNLNSEYYTHNNYDHEKYMEEYVELICSFHIPFVPEKGMIFKFSKIEIKEKYKQFYQTAIEECVTNKWIIENGSIYIDRVSFDTTNNEFLIIGFPRDHMKGYNTKQALACAVRQLIYGFGFYNERKLIPHYSMKTRNSIAKQKTLSMHISLNLYLYVRNEKGIGHRYLYAELTKKTEIPFYPSKHMSFFLDKCIDAHYNPELNNWYKIALSLRPDPISLKVYSDESGELTFLDAMYYPRDTQEVKARTMENFKQFPADFDKPQKYIQDILNIEPKTPYEIAVYNCISNHWIHITGSITVDKILFYSVDENCIYVKNDSFKSHTYTRISEIENAIEQYIYGFGFEIYKKYNKSIFTSIL